MGTRMRAWLSVGMAAVCALLVSGCAQGEAALEVDAVNLQAAVEEREEIPAWAAPYVTEETGPYGQEIRRWSRPEPETLPEAGPEEMRGLLTALGLDQDAVASYPLERLEEFCSAKTITVHSAYLRTEEDGTVSYHTREEALAELTADQKRETGDAWMNLRVGWTSGSEGPEGDLFTVTALWLTQPAQGWEDVIGIAVKGYTADDSTLRGWYRSSGEDEAGAGLEDGTAYQTLAAPDWEGGAMILDLAGTAQGQGKKAYMELYARPLYPEISMHSQVCGTYLHQREQQEESPALGLLQGPEEGEKNRGWLEHSVTVSKSLREQYAPRTLLCEFFYAP